MSEATQRIANFSPEQLRKLARRFSNKAAAMQIPRRSQERTAFPLSFGQERLWFLDQLNPGNYAYNLPFGIRFRSPIDRGLTDRTIDAKLLISLHRSTVNELVRRHEILRTSFPAIDGLPVQIVSPPASVPLEYIELLGLSEAERAETATRISTEDSRKPFDLANGPLCRFGLIQFAPNDHVGFSTFHHIVVDGWSQKTLAEEFQSLLLSALVGGSYRLPELTIQYGDYAVWQREWLQGEVWEGLRSYWAGQLRRVADLQVPTDYPRPMIQSMAGASEPIFLENSFCDSLRLLGQGHGVTLSMTLLAAWLTLLMRYTGETDVAVCTPVANRTQVETEAMIGFFTNTLVVRVDLSGDPTFAELLRRVWEVCTNAYAHQAMPFERLVQELQPARILGQNPLSRIAFQLVDIPTVSDGARSDSSASDVSITPLEIDPSTSMFDLNCDLWGYFGGKGMQRPAGIHGRLVYSTDLFGATTVQRIVKHYLNLLHAAVLAPGLRVGELELVGEEEREQLLGGWNGSRGEDGAVCLQALFEAQVERTPGAMAVEWKGERLTYAELNGRANQMAHHLRGLGVGAEKRVAICLERGVEMIVSLLGVLKAGGAYVPLDAKYPLARLRFMLDDSQAMALITQERLLSQVEGYAGRLLSLEQEEAALRSQPRNNPAPSAQPDNLAYLIYTSGSTGRPKGVAIAHRSASTLMHWARESFAPQQLRRVLASTSICFDLSVFEIFAPLSWGYGVVLVDNVLELSALSPDAAVTLINTVPSAMAELLRLGDLPASVNTVALAGEPLSNTLVQQIYLQPGVGAVLNLYGPSEDTTYSTWAELKKGGPGPIPIGRPITNTQAYVLDEQGQPVPLGVSGELYLGGDGLARCYHDRPELTADKFTPNPFSAQPGARLYHTGDLARRRSDGALEYLGRGDQQVKIRGFRIECGEIEAALLLHPLILQTAVLPRRAKNGDLQLIAYVVPSAPAAVNNRELREHLLARLPEHMVPSNIVRLAQMPLTPNNKLDRDALPDPEFTRDSGPVFVAPQNAIEMQLAEIWSEILGVTPIGVHDSFFDLGGHSLLATRVISRVRSTFQVAMPLRSIFEAPTVGQLAAKIEVALSLRTTIVPPIRPVPRDQPLPLSFAQQRLWFLDQFQTDGDIYNLPAALQIDGALQFSALQASLQEIVCRHEVLRTCFVVHDGEALQEILAPPVFSLPLLDLSFLADAEKKTRLHQFLREQSHLDFDLSTGPLLRANLIRLNSQQHVLALNMHHIISDGWSVGVLLNELDQLYKAYLHGQPSPLPDLAIQYADFAVWQRKWLQGEVLDKELSYWRKHLADLPEILELPTDHDRPAIQRFRGSRQTLSVPDVLKEQLKRVSREQDVTLFMTLLAVFGVLLQRYSGKHDLAIGTPIANRNQVEIEGLIGFFANTLVLRVDLQGDPTFPELLARVRETSLGAYAHQDLPFEKLVEELHPTRSTGHTPLFQVMFTLQNESESIAVKSHLVPIDLETLSVKFDIVLAVEELAEGLQMHMDYRTDIFEPSTARRMLGHFENLLSAVVRTPANRLSELEMLSGRERLQMLVEWNSPFHNEDSSSLCVHELFEEQVERTPNAVAVQFERQQLTYRELSERTNQVASNLVARGIGPESITGICLQRSLEMVVAILGVLKAGGAYLPLDPGYPRERLAFMLENSRAQIVLTEVELAHAVEGCGPEVVILEALLSDAHGPKLSEPPLSNRHPAYVIYTSGSTGEPKGVLITHRSLTNHMEWMRKVFHLDADDAVLQKTTFSFDASVWEFFAPLLAGARLVMARPGGQQDPEYLIQCIKKEEVTVLQLVPLQLQLLLEQEEIRECTSLRRVYCGGEQLTTNLVDRLLARLPHIRLYNLYGPTEATIDATFAECHEGEERDTALIGRPIANTQVHLLDGEMQLVPVGALGQIYIGGAALARGYMHRADLTAEAFVPDPYTSRAGDRLYRTGDMARRLPNGDLEYIGRIDNQVKIKGFRIECGEIEAVLMKHPRVSEAAVTVMKEEGDIRLLAYVVCLPPSEVGSHELRQYLRDHLPEYMVPNAVVLLPAMPLTPNGKLDRKALSTETRTNTQERTLIAPRDVTELELLRIWEDFLDARPIGIRDNFFDLGGHSLLAVRLMARIRASFGQSLPLMALFQAPDVEQLARRLRESTPQQQRSSLVLIQAGSSSAPFFLIHPIGGQVLCYYELARHLGAEQTVYGLEATGFDRTAEPSIEAMAARYVDAIQEIQPVGPYCLGGWSIGGIIAFEMARLLRHSGHEIELLAILDSPAPQQGGATTAASSLASIAHVFHLYAGQPLSVSEEQLSLLDRERQLDVVLAEMKEKDLAPPDVDVSYLREFLQVAESNLRATWNYVPLPYAGEITLLRAQEFLPGFEAEHDREIYLDYTLGWGQLSTQPVIVHSIPGNHVSMLDRAHVQVVADLLAESLGLVQSV